MDLLNTTLEAVVDRLPARARPYAKAIIPATATLAATLVTLLVEGSLSGPALRTALVGFAASALALAFPNRTTRTEAPDLAPSMQPPLLPGEPHEPTVEGTWPKTEAPA